MFAIDHSQDANALFDASDKTVEILSESLAEFSPPDFAAALVRSGFHHLKVEGSTVTASAVWPKTLDHNILTGVEEYIGGSVTFPLTFSYGEARTTTAVFDLYIEYWVEEDQESMTLRTQFELPREGNEDLFEDLINAAGRTQLRWALRDAQAR